MQIENLLANIRKEAQQEVFSIDTEIYHTYDRDPLEPILFAGSPLSPVCFFARDLGKDEVRAKQPLYGAAGKLVRNGIYQALYGEKPTTQEQRQQAANHVFLTNTVPYKPEKNKAYSTKVKERFRPHLANLLAKIWQGKYIIPLGTEALKWFTPYGGKKQIQTFIKDTNRFTKTCQVTIETIDGTKKIITLAPLPHPSPLNQKYYKLFPEMLQKRLTPLKHLLQKNSATRK